MSDFVHLQETDILLPMGAWGVRAFENDSACDWAGSLTEKSDLRMVETAIEAVVAPGGNNSGVAIYALAACEVVARLQGNWGTCDAYTEEVDCWIKQHPTVPSSKLVRAATDAIDRILDTSSDLRELWDDDPEWMSDVYDLQWRISGAILPSESELLAAARSVLGDRRFETEICEITQIPQLHLVMSINEEAMGIDEIGMDQVSDLGDFEVDDELLIPLYYLPRDQHRANDLRESVQFILSALPSDVFQVIQRALKIIA